MNHIGSVGEELGDYPSVVIRVLCSPSLYVWHPHRTLRVLLGERIMDGITYGERFLCSCRSRGGRSHSGKSASGRSTNREIHMDNRELLQDKYEETLFRNIYCWWIQVVSYFFNCCCFILRPSAGLPLPFSSLLCT